MKAQAEKNTPKRLRLARLAAAAEFEDARFENARVVVAAGLKRLGMKEMSAYAKDGIDVHELDERAIERKWSDNERVMVKGLAHKLGLVENRSRYAFPPS